MDTVAGMPKPIEIRIIRTSLEHGHLQGNVRDIVYAPRSLGASRRQASRAIIVHEILTYVVTTLWLRNSHVVEDGFMVTRSVWWWEPLVEERERACDEEVLELGSNARSMPNASEDLRVLRRISLPCVSGHDGADLKRRIVRS